MPIPVGGVFIKWMLHFAFLSPAPGGLRQGGVYWQGTGGLYGDKLQTALVSLGNCGRSRLAIRKDVSAYRILHLSKESNWPQTLGDDRCFLDPGLVRQVLVPPEVCPTSMRSRRSAPHGAQRSLTLGPWWTPMTSESGGDEPMRKQMSGHAEWLDSSVAYHRWLASGKSGLHGSVGHLGCKCQPDT